MGQKVHPTGFRLGISTDYSSKWYASSKDYSSYLLEDYRIREYLKKELESASVSKIVIERPTKEAVINIFTSRPGIVIGKKGEDIVDCLQESSTEEIVRAQRALFVSLQF